MLNIAESDNALETINLFINMFITSIHSSSPPMLRFTRCLSASNCT